MNQIRQVSEPMDAHLVNDSLQQSLDSMKSALRSIESGLEGTKVMSTPVMGHVFYVTDGVLVCVPSSFVYHGSLESGAASEACSPMELDMSVNAKKALIEAVDEWVSRPVFNESRQALTAV